MSIERLAELRAAAREREATMRGEPETAEEIAERAAEMPFWEALQAESMARED